HPAGPCLQGRRTALAEVAEGAGPRPPGLRRLRRGYRPIAVLLGRIDAGPRLRRLGASQRAGTRLPRRASLEPGARPSTSTLLISEASLDSRARTMDWKYKALLQWGFSHLPGG